jgi:hypothetical protein
VCKATSPAVSAPSFESALSTLAFVAPDMDRAGALAGIERDERATQLGGFGKELVKPLLHVLANSIDHAMFELLGLRSGGDSIWIASPLIVDARPW